MGWHFAHVTTRVAKRWDSASLTGNVEQLLRIVEAIDVISGLGQQVRMPSLSRWNVEYARSNREAQDLN